MGARLSDARWWGGTYKRPTPERPTPGPSITWTPLPMFDHRLYREWLRTQAVWEFWPAPAWAFRTAEDETRCSR